MGKLGETGDHTAALESLAIVSRRRVASPSPGRRPGLATGYSVDFADYRRYSPGDDVRHIDWALFNRLRKLYSRTFRAESDLKVHLLVDVSGSMRYGAADKLDYAKRLVMALCHVGLSHLDLVGLVTFSDRVQQILPPRRAKEQIGKIRSALDEIEPGGKSDLTRAATEFAAVAGGGGLAIVLSDFFYPGGCAQGLETLLYRKFELTLIQVIAPEELDPRFDEDVELEDSEDTTLPRILARGDTVSRYRENLGTFQASLASFCSRHRITFAQAITSCPFEELILQLQRQGVWESR